MSSGYESQFTDDEQAGAATRFENPSDRMRAALAALLSQGASPNAAPLEDLWAAQGRSQLPPPIAAQQWDLPLGPQGDYAPMPQRGGINPPNTRFPQAQMAPDSPLQSRKPPPDMPRLSDEPQRPPQDPAPFHGEGSYMGAYKLPEKKEKKKGKR